MAAVLRGRARLPRASDGAAVPGAGPRQRAGSRPKRGAQRRRLPRLPVGPDVARPRDHRGRRWVDRRDARDPRRRRPARPARARAPRRRPAAGVDRQELRARRRRGRRARRAGSASRTPTRCTPRSRSPARWGSPRRHGVALLSLTSRQLTRSFWERVVQPVVFGLLDQWFPLARVNDPASPARRRQRDLHPGRARRLRGRGRTPRGGRRDPRGRRARAAREGRAAGGSRSSTAPTSSRPGCTRASRRSGAAGRRTSTGCAAGGRSPRSPPSLELGVTLVWPAVGCVVAVARGPGRVRMAGRPGPRAGPRGGGAVPGLARGRSPLEPHRAARRRAGGPFPAGIGRSRLAGARRPLEGPPVYLTVRPCRAATPLKMGCAAP